MYSLCSLYSDIYLSLISTQTTASLRQKQWLQKPTGYLQRINLSKCLCIYFGYEWTLFCLSATLYYTQFQSSMWVCTHQSVNDGTNCSIEHMQPWNLLSDREEVYRFKTDHTDKKPAETEQDQGGPHILEGEDDGCNNPDDHEQNGSNSEKSPAGGEVHLWWGRRH